MTDARRLVSRVAGETVQDITERYEGYHEDLVRTFTQVLRIQQSEPSKIAQRRTIEQHVKAFADQVANQFEDSI